MCPVTWESLLKDLYNLQSSIPLVLGLIWIKVYMSVISHLRFCCVLWVFCLLCFLNFYNYFTKTASNNFLLCTNLLHKLSPNTSISDNAPDTFPVKNILLIFSSKELFILLYIFNSADRRQVMLCIIQFNRGAYNAQIRQLLVKQLWWILHLNSIMFFFQYFSCTVYRPQLPKWM